MGRSDPQDARRRNIRRAMGIGVWVWPIFLALDAYMCFLVYPGAPFMLFVVYRFVVEVLLLVVYRQSRRSEANVSQLSTLQSLAYFVAAFFVALMAIPLGGIHSSYMHGISIVILVRSTVIPEPWRRAFPLSLALALVFPVVMAAVAALSPPSREAWLHKEALAMAGAHYVFVLASAIVGMAAGHTVWTAQQQLYRARRLGRYRLQVPIARGGMGEVWLAWDESLRRNLALKILRGAEDPDGSRRQRFEREARAASRLRGAHTIRIFDYGASDDGIYYIAMEYLPGFDLWTLVKQHGPMQPQRVVHLAIQACFSLEEAHTAGIVHRDIKPNNLFVTQEGDEPDFLKLLDFGVARDLGPDTDVTLTRTGMLAGTPAYVAPEVWMGMPSDARSDLYGLGATLYYLLAGVNPFEAQTPSAFMAAHVQSLPPPPSVRRGEVIPPELETLVLRCLAKDPSLRYQSAGELRRALQELHDPNGWTSEHARAFWLRVLPQSGGAS